MINEPLRNRITGWIPLNPRPGTNSQSGCNSFLGHMLYNFSWIVMLCWWLCVIKNACIGGGSVCMYGWVPKHRCINSAHAAMVLPTWLPPNNNLILDVSRIHACWGGVGRKYANGFTSARRLIFRMLPVIARILNRHPQMRRTLAQYDGHGIAPQFGQCLARHYVIYGPWLGTGSPF